MTVTTENVLEMQEIMDVTFARVCERMEYQEALRWARLLLLLDLREVGYPRGDAQLHLFLTEMWLDDLVNALPRDVHQEDKHAVIVVPLEAKLQEMRDALVVTGGNGTDHLRVVGLAALLQKLR